MVIRPKKVATRRFARNRFPHSVLSPSATALETMGDTICMQMIPIIAIVKNIDCAMPDAPRLSAAPVDIWPT